MADEKEEACPAGPKGVKGPKGIEKIPKGAMMETLLYYRFDDEADPKSEGQLPPDGEVRLVVAWTTCMPDPRARRFWTFAHRHEGKWIENVSKMDLSDVVEYWCDLPDFESMDG